MSRERRQGAATALVGTGLTGASAVVRHRAIQQAIEESGRPVKRGFPHSVGLERRLKGARTPIKLKFAGGAAGGAVGAAGMGYGITQMVRPRRKVEVGKGVLREGLKGQADALLARRTALEEQKQQGNLGRSLAETGAAGLVGSQAAHKIIDRKFRSKGGHWAGRPAATAIAGVTAASAYQMTASGVRRRKKKPVPPSRSAQVLNQRQMGTNGFRRAVVPSSVGKRERYYGENMTFGQKYARTMAAGGVPVVGDFTAAAQAGRMVPREQRRKASATQYLGANAGQFGGMAAGAYGAAALANKDKGAREAMGRMEQRRGAAMSALKRPGVRALNNVKARVGIKPSEPKMKPYKHPRIDRLARRLGPNAGGKLLRAAKPLRGAAAPAAMLGAFGGQVIGGQTGGYAAARTNYRREQKWKAANVRKSASTEGLTQRDKVKLARKKRLSAALSATGGVAGLTGLGLMARGKPKGALWASTVGGGIGGANALLNTPIQRKEAQIIAPKKPVTKAMSDEDYELEAQSLSEDIGQLYKAKEDKDPKRIKHWSGQILLAMKDYADEGERDLVEDACEALASTMSPSWYRRNVTPIEGSRHLVGDAPNTKYKRDARGRFTKSMPSGLHVRRAFMPAPSGLRQRKTYTASAIRTTRQGRLYRVKAGVR